MVKRKGQTILTDYFRRVKRHQVTKSIMTSTQTENSIKKHGSDDYPAMPNVFNQPGIYGFPRNIITRLRYKQYLSFAVTTIGGNTFLMNSIFDPDVSGAGHQPLYHDQLSALYNHYTVLGSKLTCEFTVTNTATPALVGIMVGDDSSFTTTIETAAEQNKSVSTTLGGNSSQGSATLSVTYGAQEDEGIDPYAGSDLIRTAFGSNPTEGYYARVYAAAYDVTTSTGIFGNVTIEYTVLCSELKDVTQS